eukprot:jgi/Phyca11/14024/fgenesh1_pg.PHYCAscaffold_5_\
MSKPSTSVTDKLAFHGKKSLFAGWKDRIRQHLEARSDALAVAELQAGRKEPVSRFEDALVREPVLQEPGQGATQEEKNAYALQKSFIRQQSSYIKDLFNLTLRARFADERLMHRPVHEIWRAIEMRYGLNAASGVIELVKRSDSIVNSDFKSVGHLFQQLKAAREQANRNSSEAMKIGLISQQLMLIKGSGIMFTPEEFTTEKVETKFISIFQSQSRVEIDRISNAQPVNNVEATAIKPKGSALGKRKATATPNLDVWQNAGDNSCFYCLGAYHDTAKTGPHQKGSCPKMKQDRANKVYRRNLWEKASPEDRRKYDAILAKISAKIKNKKAKGNGKGKIAAKSKSKAKNDVKPSEADQCEVPGDAVHASAPASPAVSISPPSSMQLPLTPCSGMPTVDEMDTDEPMSSFEMSVNVGNVRDALAEVQPTVEDMNQM